MLWTNLNKPSVLFIFQHYIMKRFILYLLPFCITLLFASSCIKDGENMENCQQYIRFVYDYNLKYTDLFPAQVTKVDLYIFDQNGLYVSSLHDEQKTFHSDYKMLLPTLPDGKYQFVAWAGLYSDSYHVSPMEKGKSTINDLLVEVNKYETGKIDFEMKPLWFGSRTDVTLSSNRMQIETISLTKNTNKFRIVMQMLNDNTKINVNDYDFKIISANGIYDHTNIVSGKNITYTPYYTFNDTTAGAVAELNTLRLMAKADNRLIITDNKTKNKIFDIPLNKYLNALRLQQYENMPLQEYLDREDTYAIILFFKDNGGGGNGADEGKIIVSVRINGWLVREQELEDLSI